jgi:hypothetical protein
MKSRKRRATGISLVLVSTIPLASNYWLGTQRAVSAPWSPLCLGSLPSQHDQLVFGCWAAQLFLNGQQDLLKLCPDNFPGADAKKSVSLGLAKRLRR